MKLAVLLLLSACAAPRSRSGSHPRNRSAYPPPGSPPCIAAVCVVPT